MARYPDPVQRVNRSSDNVPGIARWRTQFFRRDISVVRLFDGERRGFDECGNVPAVLALTAQFFQLPAQRTDIWPGGAHHRW